MPVTALYYPTTLTELLNESLKNQDGRIEIHSPFASDRAELALVKKEKWPETVAISMLYGIGFANYLIGVPALRNAAALDLDLTDPLIVKLSLNVRALMNLSATDHESEIEAICTWIAALQEVAVAKKWQQCRCEWQPTAEGLGYPLFQAFYDHAWRDIELDAYVDANLHLSAWLVRLNGLLRRRVKNYINLPIAGFLGDTVTLRQLA